MTAEFINVTLEELKEEIGKLCFAGYGRSKVTFMGSGGRSNSMVIEFHKDNIPPQPKKQEEAPF